MKYKIGDVVMINEKGLNKRNNPEFIHFASEYLNEKLIVRNIADDETHNKRYYLLAREDGRNVGFWGKPDNNFAPLYFQDDILFEYSGGLSSALNRTKTHIEIKEWMNK